MTLQSSFAPEDDIALKTRHLARFGMLYTAKGFNSMASSFPCTPFSCEVVLMQYILSVLSSRETASQMWDAISVQHTAWISSFVSELVGLDFGSFISSSLLTSTFSFTAALFLGGCDGGSSSNTWATDDVSFLLVTTAKARSLKAATTT